MDYRTSDYPTTSSTVLLSLLLEHSNDIALQGTEPLDTLNKNSSESGDNRVSDYRVPKTEDRLSALDNNLDYDNSDDLKNYPSNKKRRTRVDHSITSDDIVPTTKRGLPPTESTSRPRSWYYITKDYDLTTTEMSRTESTVKDVGNETTMLDVIAELSTTESTTEYSTMSSAMTDFTGEDVTMSFTSTLDLLTESDTSKSSPVFIPAVTPIFRPTERSNVTLPESLVTDPETNSIFETITEGINDTSKSQSTPLNISKTTTESTVNLNTTPMGIKNVTVSLTSSTEPIVLKSEIKSVEVSKEEDLKTTTLKEIISTTQTSLVNKSKIDRRRERIGSDTGSRAYGRKVFRRPLNRNYFTELRESSERRTNEEERRKSQHIRARLPSSRGRHRYRTSSSLATSTSSTPITTTSTDSMTSTVKIKESTATIESTEKSTRNTSEFISEESILEEKDKSEISADEDNAEGRSLALDTTEKPEVTTIKSTRITSRTSAALSTRLRKVSTTVATIRESSLANPRRTTLPKPNIPVKDVIVVTEEPKKGESVDEKPGLSDQSSRAQEIAVTMTEPPPTPAPSTGRLPTRDTLRRKISTTVAPRADTTTTTTTTATSRSTIRFRGRQKNKKEKSLPNVTTRPRRPAIIDYDYYEDELEPVVAKSTLSGKLFLTSRGTIRCLDQGNFPHPYSCKKFITCARMVNGQVIGAEYTCPNKLSFDPIGGICNWSAGLGCKE